MQHLVVFHDNATPLTLCFTYARNVVVVANTFLQESIADLPSEDRRAFPLVIGDFVHHRRGSHARLATADRTWLDRTGLVVPERSKAVSFQSLKFYREITKIFQLQQTNVIQLEFAVAYVLISMFNPLTTKRVYIRPSIFHI